MRKSRNASTRLFQQSRKTGRGSTLIIVVVFLVLLSVLVLGFLARALLDLEISDSSANLSKVDFFARGAVDSVIGDLKQEIVDGSTTTNSLYLPNTSTNMVPAYSGISPVISNGVETDGLNNVLKVSLNNSPFHVGSSINRASNIATTTASLDKHSISLANWNKPLLMPATSTTDLTPTATGFPTPTWIYVARDGSNPGSATNTPNFGATGSTVNNSSSSNSSYVVGRYSYVIYNEGGLLDANVAGSPDVASMSVAQNQIWTRKGPAAFADLTQLPTLSALGTARAQGIVDSLIGWRSQASSQPSGSFPSYSFSGAPITSFLNFQRSQTANWMTTGNSTLCNNQSDRVFTSRQQLISFLQGVAQSSTEKLALQNTLQYLGTFSRSLNQPSYCPPSNRPVVVGAVAPNAAATGYSGGNSAYGLDNVYNPCFRTVQVKTPFIRNDGAIAKVGAPLVEKRFALSRLCWLTYKGPSATVATSDPLIQQYLAGGVTLSLLNEGTATNIYKYFGLTWTAGPGTGGIGGYWTYAHGIATATATVIGSLHDPSSSTVPQDVVSANREPDFFELLKAGVCVGAIAKTKSGNNFGTDYNGVVESVVTFQILQLGANIINQSNPSQYPIWIKYNYGDTGGYIRSVYGSTDLPGYYSMLKTAFVVTPSAVTPGPWPPNISSPPSSTGQTISDPGRICAMMMPTIWNPYDINGPSVPSNLAPSQLRITIVPAALTDPTNIPGGSSNPTSNSYWSERPCCMSSGWSTLSSEGSYTNALWTNEDSTAMTFSNVSSLYRQPTVLFQQNLPAGSNLQLGPSNILQSMPGASASGYTEMGSGTSFIGFPLGSWNQAWTDSSTNKIYVANVLAQGNFGAKGNTIRLEYQVGANWIPYREIYTFITRETIPIPITEDGTSANPTLLSPSNTNCLWVGSQTGNRYGGAIYAEYSDSNLPGCWGSYVFDPRTSRWGCGTITPAPQFTTVPVTQSERPDGSTLKTHLFSGSNASEGWINPTSGGAGVFSSTNMGGPTQNIKNTGIEYYWDPDGVVRRAMGGLVNVAKPTSTVALPMATPPSASSTPIILHRPFRSVAELGYVFSDTPWRNIDFFTPESGYAPLLDLFCVNEDYRLDALVAGKVDLNTRQEPVIQALLAGAYRDESTVAAGGTDSPLLGGSGAEAATIANLLLARTSPYNGALGKGPLTNIADLVGHYVPGFTNTNGQPYDGFSSDLVGRYSGGTSSGNNLIQRFMEATPRALSDSGQVGTWNLLIDIVAQNGRCSPGATSLANFMVQGENHYWVHVAIDRQTGKIIDENIESVDL